MTDWQAMKTTPNLERTPPAPEPDVAASYDLRVHSGDRMRVVVNRSKHHSLWPLESPLPRGWVETGFSGTQPECLDEITRLAHEVASDTRAERPNIDPKRADALVDVSFAAAWGPQCALPDAPIHALIRRKNEEDPGAIALREGERFTTRGELNRRSRHWAKELIARGARAGCPIAMLVPRSIEAVVAILAILDSGSPYLPLQCDAPVEQLLRILADAGAPLVLADEHQARRLEKYQGAVVVVEELDESLGDGPEFVADRSGFQDLAYIMYTSGTTGAPKGVMGNHSQLVNYVTWCAEHFELEQGETTVLHAPLHFLGSVMTVFTPLVAGWELVIASAPLEMKQLVATTAGTECGFFKITPSHVRAMAPLGSLAGIARQVMITSETLYMTPELQNWVEGSPGSTFVNQWGMSETCGSTCYWIPPGIPTGQRIPVGRPISNAEAYIIDQDGHLVSLGEVGELCMAGAPIGEGYWGQPALTAERWIPNPWGSPGSRLLRTGDLARMDATGTVDIIGRADRQVKIRGHRVELPSIEEVLRRYEGVGDAVVLPDEAKNPLELVAYVRLIGDDWPTVAMLRDHIARSLPDYAIPSRFAYLRSFPVTENGKVDFRALPGAESFPPPTARDFAEPSSPTELEICRAFAEVLAVERIGALDNFFELGGNSLQIVEAVTALDAALGTDLSVTDVFDHPNARALALYIETQTA